MKNFLFQCQLCGRMIASIIDIKAQGESCPECNDAYPRWQPMPANFTPHVISVIERASARFDKNIRKWVSDNPQILMSIPSVGMLSAVIETVDEGKVGTGGVPIFSKKVTGCEPVPDYGDSPIIVSALYVSAVRSMGLPADRLYTVADPVYTPDGKTILGSLGICPAF